MSNNSKQTNVNREYEQSLYTKQKNIWIPQHTYLQHIGKLKNSRDQKKKIFFFF